MELIDILQQIDSLKQEAEDLQPIKPELEKVFWDKFRLEFNYNSNHMEGNTLTYGHTQILLKSGDVVGKYNIRELQEMKAHDLALKIIRESAEDPEFSLSQKFIKEINETILVEPYYNDAITPDGRPTQKLIVPGKYKKTPNSVRLPNGEIFNYPSPEETPALMGDLIDWYEKETTTKELHPVQIAALFHYKIVRIHPFDDSNGRTARLLMNYILLTNNYAPLVIESADKKNYLMALNEADAGNLEAFIIYITNLSLRWQGLLTKSLKGKNIEEKGDFEKEIQLLKKKLDDRNEKNEIVFSFNILNQILTKDIYYLTSTLIAEISVFDTFFADRHINFLQKAGDSENFVLTDIIFPEKIKDYFDKLSEILWNKTLPIIITFNYQHKNLKKTTLTDFSYTTSIQCTFNLTSYKINSNSNDAIEIEKKYNEQISEPEIKSFVEFLTKRELQKIKIKL